MAEHEEETEKEVHRVTVVFNTEDLSRITAQVDKRTKEKGYRVYRADELRALVRDHWPVPLPLPAAVPE